MHCSETVRCSGIPLRPFFLNLFLCWRACSALIEVQLQPRDEPVQYKGLHIHDEAHTEHFGISLDCHSLDSLRHRSFRTSFSPRVSSGTVDCHVHAVLASLYISSLQVTTRALELPLDWNG